MESKLFSIRNKLNIRIYLFSMYTVKRLQWGQKHYGIALECEFSKSFFNFKYNFSSILAPLRKQITSLSAHPQGLITMCLLCILCYKFDFKNLCGTIYLKLYAKYKHTQMCFVESLNQYKKIQQKK